MVDPFGSGANIRKETYETKKVFYFLQFFNESDKKGAVRDCSVQKETPGNQISSGKPKGTSKIMRQPPV